MSQKVSQKGHTMSVIELSWTDKRIAPQPSKNRRWFFSIKAKFFHSPHNPYFSWCLFVISATCPHRPIGGLLEPWYQVISERIALVYCLRHCRQHCSQTNRELSTEKPMYSILESSHLVCRLERGFFPANQCSKDFLIHGYIIVVNMMYSVDIMYC